MNIPENLDKNNLEQNELEKINHWLLLIKENFKSFGNTPEKIILLWMDVYDLWERYFPNTNFEYKNETTTFINLVKFESSEYALSVKNKFSQTIETLSIWKLDCSIQNLLTKAENALDNMIVDLKKWKIDNGYCKKIAFTIVLSWELMSMVENKLKELKKTGE